MPTDDMRTLQCQTIAGGDGRVRVRGVIVLLWYFDWDLELWLGHAIQALDLHGRWLCSSHACCCWQAEGEC